MKLYNRINSEVLKQEMLESDEKRVTLSFYKYAKIDDPKVLRNKIYQEWSELGVFGRIYVANEGINGQLSLPEGNVEKFREVVYACIFEVAYLLMVFIKWFYSFLFYIALHRSYEISDLANFIIEHVLKVIFFLIYIIFGQNLDSSHRPFDDSNRISAELIKRFNSLFEIVFHFSECSLGVIFGIINAGELFIQLCLVTL